MTTPAQRAKERSRNRPRSATPDFIAGEMTHCKADFFYWCNNYCFIYDNEAKAWIRFLLWPAQTDAAHLALENQYALALKTRQVGFTWLWAIAIKLWKMIFHPITRVLVFSQGEDEAFALLSEQRMRGMWMRLPEWMRLNIGDADSKSVFSLDNGSGIEALPPTRGGDSRTVTDLVIDEADLIANFSELLARAEPTVGRNGSILLIGRAAKNTPNSPFKKMYRAAKVGESKYKAIFIAWWEHPEWDQARYDREKADILARTGSLDDLYEQHPATDTEALAARSLDKRFHPEIISAVCHNARQVSDQSAPQIPGLRLYRLPEPGHKYGIGADASGGKTDGDPAVAQVVDAATSEQVAVLEGKFEADVFGGFVADLATYFNGAVVLPELNNHGLLLLKVLQARGTSLRSGINRRGDTGKPGWLTTAPSKNMLYDTLAKVFQDVMAEAEQSGQSVLPVVCDFKTASELAGLDINTLSAPEGEHDDHAISYALAQMCVYRGSAGVVAVRHDLWTEKPGPKTEVQQHAPFHREVERTDSRAFVSAGEALINELIKRGLR